MNHAIPLQLLASGERACIAQIAGETQLRQRLHEMGLAEGETLEVVQPGSPCIVRLNGHKLCLRAEDILRVLVVVEGRATEAHSTEQRAAS